MLKVYTRNVDHLVKKCFRNIKKCRTKNKRNTTKPENENQKWNIVKFSFFTQQNQKMKTRKWKPENENQKWTKTRVKKTPKRASRARHVAAAESTLSDDDRCESSEEVLVKLVALLIFFLIFLFHCALVGRPDW